jgi:hypothetical protein
MMILSGLSVAAVGRGWVEGAPGWTEPLAFWGVSALPPGSRKSPVVGEIAAPFDRLELEAAETYRTEAQGKEGLLEAAKARHAATVTRLGKLDSLDGGIARAGLEAELAAAEKEIDELTVAEPRQYLTADFTPESLAMELNENGGVIGVLEDEGGVFGNITGRYTNGTPKLDLILKSYDGKRPFKQSRVGRHRINVPWPTIAIGLAVQPSVLADTTATPMLRERGLMGRFAYCVPADTVGTRTNRGVPELPQALREAWTDTLETITALPLCEPGQPRRIIRLDHDAQEAHLDYRDALEPRLHPETGDLAFMADWASKHAGRVLRVAGLLHLAAGHDPAEPIDFRTMAAAIDIGDWMIEHAARVYGGWRAAAGPDMTGPLAILRWIRRTQPTSFTVRDFHAASKGQVWVNAEAIKDALVVLAEAGWITSVEEHYADGKRQRRDGRFLPHPALIGGAE